MRTFKSKFFAGMTALVVAFGLFFTVNAKEEVKEVEVKESKKVLVLNPTPLFFHGNPENEDEVKNPENWTTEPNGQSCNNQNQLACSMLVDSSDLNGNQLDGNRIELGATATSSGYIPSRIGGTSPTPFAPTNRN